MKKTIYKNDFINAFEKYDRGDKFSKEGFSALFDYITKIEEDTGKEIELDVISICGEFDEYESFEEFKESYTEIKSMDELKENYSIIPVGENGFIYPNCQ